MKTFGPGSQSRAVPAILALLALLALGLPAAFYCFNYFFPKTGKRTPGFSIRIEPADGDSLPAEKPIVPGDPKFPVQDLPQKPNAVNLLAQLDTQRDTVSGKWELKNGELHGDSSEGARFQFPFEVPDEYDVLCEFTQLSGTSTFNVLLARREKMFGYTIGYHGTAGFFDVAKDVPGQTTKPFKIQQGKKYELKIEVRNDTVKAYIDGALANTWTTPFQTKPRWDGWHLKNNRYVGVGTWASPAIVHKFELKDKTTGDGAAKKGEDF